MYFGCRQIIGCGVFTDVLSVKITGSGADDAIAPVRWIKYFEDNYKIARIHKIEEAGHMLYLPY